MNNAQWIFNPHMDRNWIKTKLTIKATYIWCLDKISTFESCTFLHLGNNMRKIPRTKNSYQVSISRGQLTLPNTTKVIKNWTVIEHYLCSENNLPKQGQMHCFESNIVQCCSSMEVWDRPTKLKRLTVSLLRH